MSEAWINSSLPGRGTTRLQDAVEESVFEQITNKGYKRILSEIAPDGKIIYKEIDAGGSILNEINL